MAAPDLPEDAVAADEWRYRDGVLAHAGTALAVEMPIALEFNGVSHAVMLATPRDLEDFALGFSLSEGILARASDLYGVDMQAGPLGVTLSLEVASEAFALLKERRRTLAGRTGCGICGTESLDQVLRPITPLTAPAWRLSPEALAHAGDALPTRQPLAQRTGATHGAAWCSTDGRILEVREDVGRHNALDKLVGCLARQRIDTREGFALITSRASVEMVQKAATAGITLLAAVSAPTALARDTALRCGLALAGFARGARFSVYTFPERFAFAG